MIRGAIKLAVVTLGLACVLVVVFLVPLGERTLFEHLVRIGRTDEARDLGREVGVASERIGDEIEVRLAGDAATPPPSPTP